jgi:hypothetical protein
VRGVEGALRTFSCSIFKGGRRGPRRDFSASQNSLFIYIRRLDPSTEPTAHCALAGSALDPVCLVKEIHESARDPSAGRSDCEDVARSSEYIVAMRAWWSALSRPERAGAWLLGEEGVEARFGRALAPALLLPMAVYGLGMGSFRGWTPALISGLKLPFLFLLTIAICLPPFYAINCVWGPRLRWGPCARMMALAASASSAAVGAFAPINFFFSMTTSREGYLFLVMMHVALFALAGGISLFEIAMIFRAAAERLGRPFRRSIFLAWALLYAFVGSQVSWTLRPWIGSHSIRYQPFRPIGGSFIEAVFGIFKATIGRLVGDLMGV